MEREPRMRDDYYVSWRPEYSVHIDAIDRQHQVFVSLIRELQEAMAEGRGRIFQQTLVEKLLAYANLHFRFEEDLMREHGYELLAEHVEQHRLLTSRVGELQQRIHDGEAVSNPSLILLLRNWLTEHIMQHDQKYALAFKAKT